MIGLNGMEEGGEEAIEGFELRGKDSHHSNAVDWKESSPSPQVYSDTLVVGRNLNKRAITEPPLIYSDDGNDMVEELTLKINENSNVLVVGTSYGGNVREGMPITRQGHWNHLYQLAGGLGSGSSHRKNLGKDKEMDNEFLPEFRTQRPLHQSNQLSPEMAGGLVNGDNSTESPSGIRTKLLSSSGFSRFLVRNSLKGKGVAYRYSEPCKGLGVSHMGQSNEKAASVAMVSSPDLGVKVNHPSLHSADGAGPVSITNEVLLREWLKPGRTVNRDENLCIFKQIVELVDLAHSQQVALHVRPSCLKLLPSNQVKYEGYFSDRELFDSVMDMGVTSLAYQFSRKRFLEAGLPPSSSLNSKQQKLVKNMNFTKQLCKSSDVKYAGSQDSGYDTSQQRNLNSKHRMKNKFGIPVVSNTTQNQFIATNIQLEHKWYTSPEEHQKREHTFLSDIYCLGVLLFELFCCYESWEVHTAEMLDLRHRILPPNFLSEFPKEAGFCLWLLHPEPSSRPRTREILHSELICESREVSKGQLLLPAEEDPSESELLLHFLSSLKEIKHKRASKLVEDIGGIKADIEKVEKMHLLRTSEVLSWKHKDPSNTREFVLKEPTPSQARCTKNINQLESAYFSMRSQIQLPDTDGTGRSDKDILKHRESWFRVQNENEGNQRPTDHLGAFFDGLCKYARYNKFELRGTLRNGDLLNSANVICSLSFDRDEEYFAAAGVSKKIKIYEFNGLLNDSIDIHYPVVEMTSKSKLSCICWNNYIKNYLAATDYDGVVQLWDASTGQGFSQYTDHEQRAWSVDFSPVDPTKFASGSDDHSVKLWSINERKCTSTIRSLANVCCVQFSADSTHLLAFGSADFKTYCYDLRNTRNPWCTLAGHGKTVSYVKFLDSETLVSASTDNTLKLWDLNKTSCSRSSSDACSLTFRGHTNEKNFVGLSVSDGYIVCGSESNEVYSYYKSLPMPITAHKFGSIDPISGQENGDDSGQFVSSVCWKGKSDMVIAANSSGSIKLLQMM